MSVVIVAPISYLLAPLALPVVAGMAVIQFVTGTPILPGPSSYTSFYSKVSSLSTQPSCLAATTSGTGLSSVGSVGAVSIAGTLALPLLGALILGGLGAALARIPENEVTCRKTRKKGQSLTSYQNIADAVKRDLGLLIDAVVIAGLNADLGDDNRPEVERLVNEFKVDFEKILDTISKGQLPQTMIQSLNRKLESFQWKITEMEGENRRLRERCNELIESCSRRLERLVVQTGKNKVSGDLQNQWLKIKQMPESAFNEKIQRLTTLSAALSAIEDKQCTTDMLSKALKGLKDKSKSISRSETKLDLIEQKTLWEDIDYYMGRFQRDFPHALTTKILNLVENARKSSFVERLPVVLDQVKVEYQKHSAKKELTEYFKLKLKSYAAILPEQHKQQQELSDFLRKPVINRSEFSEMSEKLLQSVKYSIEEEQRKILQEKVQTSLFKIQYLVTENLNPEQMTGRLLNSEIVCLDTRHHNFKVLLRITKDSSVSIRLIRIVDSEDALQNQTEYQKQKDKEVRGEWCKNADLFLDSLRNEGIITFEELRLEDDVVYYTREQLRASNIDIGSEENVDTEIQTGKEQVRKRAL